MRDERGSYYYDDATGYEVYNPSDEEQEEPLKKDVDREESCQHSALSHQPPAHDRSLA